MPEHPDYKIAAGAYASFWVQTDSPDSALEFAVSFLYRNNYRVESVDQKPLLLDREQLDLLNIELIDHYNRAVEIGFDFCLVGFERKDDLLN